MKNRKNKHSGNGIQKDLALIGRGCRLLWEISPAHMIWFTVYTVFKQILPYFALYMSALLVDEIVAGAPVPRLLTLAVITVGGTLLLDLIQHLLARFTQLVLIFLFITVCTDLKDYLGERHAYSLNSSQIVIGNVNSLYRFSYGVRKFDFLLKFQVFFIIIQQVLVVIRHLLVLFKFRGVLYDFPVLLGFIFIFEFDLMNAVKLGCIIRHVVP